MMREYLVVDGYNIIFAWPEFEKMRNTGLEYAREKLLHILTNYAAMSGESVVVVFDAHLVRNNLEYTDTIGENIEVIYTREGETADSAIERLVGQLSREGRVQVATSDWAEQSMIFGLGAYRLTPRELKHRIKQLRQEGKRRYTVDPPSDSYLENRLVDEVRKKLEKWRRNK